MTSHGGTTNGRFIMENTRRDDDWGGIPMAMETSGLSCLIFLAGPYPEAMLTTGKFRWKSMFSWANCCLFIYIYIFVYIFVYSTYRKNIEIRHGYDWPVFQMLETATERQVLPGESEERRRDFTNNQTTKQTNQQTNQPTTTNILV